MWKAEARHCTKVKKQRIDKTHRMQGFEEAGVAYWKNKLIDKNGILPVFSQKHQITYINFEYSNLIFSL